MADIDGDSGNNNISGTNSSDDIDGKSGADTIDGGSGNDTVSGGDGDDIVSGGAGQDVIVGGRGDDTLYAGNSSTTDTFVYRDGDGNDLYDDFDPDEPDIIAFHVDELSTYADVTARMSTDGSDTIVTLDSGETLRFSNVSPGEFSSTNFSFNTGPICLHAGTLIQTPTGDRVIETLREGDLVITQDHGAQPIRFVVHQTLDFSQGSATGKPILIKAGALGDKQPFVDTIVSPQHRILVSNLMGAGDVLVAANKLTGRTGIRRMQGRGRAEYYNLLFDAHEIITANGCLTESLLMTPRIAQRLAIEFDEIADPAAGVMTDARPISRTDPLVAKPIIQTVRAVSQSAA